MLLAFGILFPSLFYVEFNKTLPFYICLMIGAFMVLSALVLTLTADVVMIDRGRKFLISTWKFPLFVQQGKGFTIEFYRKTHATSEYEVVQILPVRIKMTYGWKDAFAVSLVGTSQILIHNASDKLEAQVLAKEIGGFLQLPVRDLSINLKRAVQRTKAQAELELRRVRAREVQMKLYAQRLEQFSEFGRMAAALNHEIGNAIDPLGYLIEDLSKERIEHPAVQKALPLMRERMGAVERLLDALRDVSRPIQLKPERINLPRFLNSVLLDAKDLPQSKGVEFAVTVADPALACIADEPWLRRVLFNLLRNAAEACQGRPNPRVALEALVLDAFIKIEVKDNGKGMDDALLARLFEPFFSTKGSAGTGLGLFISRKVIELHGGRIEVSSKVGEGTTFAVLLPREAVKQEGLVEQGR